MISPLILLQYYLCRFRLKALSNGVLDLEEYEADDGNEHESSGLDTSL